MLIIIIISIIIIIIIIVIIALVPTSNNKLKHVFSSLRHEVFFDKNFSLEN